MAPLVGEKESQNTAGLEQGPLSWLGDSPPKRMASNPVYTSKEHGELGHDLRGTNLPAEKLQP